MSQDDRDDDQDFDALSESSFDFGHFHELDSDAEDPQVEDQGLDPFTAAQREESFALGVDEDAAVYGERPEDEKFVFTQKLLTNAQTLKQLQASGSPEIAINYEEDSKDRLQSQTRPSPDTRLPQNPAEDAHFLRRLSSEASLGAYSQRSKFHASTKREHTPVPPQAYSNYDRQSFRLLPSLSDETLVSGRFHSFPAGLLKGYTYENCCLILDNTRVYSLDGEGSSENICLQTLLQAKDCLKSPVLGIVARKDAKVLLQDLHSETEVCTIIGLLANSQEVLQENRESNVCQHIMLHEFHIDYVPQVSSSIVAPESSEITSKRVTIVEELDESFHSCPGLSQTSAAAAGSERSNKMDDNPFPAAQERYVKSPATSQQRATEPRAHSQQSKKTVKDRDDPRSVLIITKYEFVDISDLRRAWDRDEANKHMYDGEDVQSINAGTQVTVETDYSDPYGEHLDMQDFPVYGTL